MTWEETIIHLKHEHIYPDPLLSESGSVCGLTVNANEYTKEDKIFYLQSALEKKEFKVVWDKKISKVVITKK